jgi:cation transport protein ChaC
MSNWAGLGNGGELWVFGYGSLMWRPGFPSVEVARARLDGYRRCFCVYSTRHRGTAQRPGLVLGLDRGGSCVGLAYRVARADVLATLGYLREREQMNGIYRECLVPVQLLDGSHREVEARAYVVERWHPSYTGRLALSTQARLIRAARGISGCNLDYLINTVAHLRQLTIREPDLERILALAGPHVGHCGRSGADRPAASALRRVCQRHGVAAPILKLEARRRFTHRRQLAQHAERARHKDG